MNCNLKKQLSKSNGPKIPGDIDIELAIIAENYASIDTQVLKSFIERNNSKLKEYSESFQKFFINDIDCNAFRFASDKLRGNAEFIEELLKEDPDRIDILSYITDELKGDDDFFISVVDIDPEALGYASDELRGNAEFIEDLLEEDPDRIDMLSYITDELKGDDDFFISVVDINPKALGYASPEVRGSEYAMKECVSVDGLALAFASDTLKRNESVIMGAAIRNIEALKFVPVDFMYSDQNNKVLSDAAKKIICSAISTAEDYLDRHSSDYLGEVFLQLLLTDVPDNCFDQIDSAEALNFNQEYGDYFKQEDVQRYIQYRLYCIYGDLGNGSMQHLPDDVQRNLSEAQACFKKGVSEMEAGIKAGMSPKELLKILAETPFFIEKVDYGYIVENQLLPELLKLNQNIFFYAKPDCFYGLMDSFVERKKVLPIDIVKPYGFFFSEIANKDSGKAGALYNLIHKNMRNIYLLKNTFPEQVKSRYEAVKTLYEIRQKLLNPNCSQNLAVLPKEILDLIIEFT